MSTVQQLKGVGIQKGNQVETAPSKGPISKPNFGNDDDNDGEMIMSNNPMNQMFKSKDEQAQFMDFFSKI